MNRQRLVCGIVLLLVIFDQKTFGQSTLSPPYTCTTTVCHPGGEMRDRHGESMSTVSQGVPGKRGPVGPRGEKGDPCQCDVADEEAMHNLRVQWNGVKENYKALVRRLDDIDSKRMLAENCTVWKSQLQEGVFSFDVVPIYSRKFIGDLTPVMTNCTKILAEDADGWIVIQRRMNGGTDFYLNWESYVKGFGDALGEFWIGLGNLHLMTSKRRCKLRIDFRDWDKSTRFAEYSTFRVAGEEALFALTISGYTGNIHDSMAHHNGRRFSTYDRDNDNHGSIHCAERYKGAWWHGACHDSNLNGIYFKTAKNDNTGVWWDGFSRSLPFVEMKVFCS